jgi:hypothetical protein
MSQDMENFDSLQRLLSLKRHEQPPPGYFDSFSREVILRIKAGERGEEAFGYFWQLPWLQRIWGALEARPVLTGSFGVAACAFLVLGVVNADTDRLDVQSMATVGPQGVEASRGMHVANNFASDQPLLARPASMEISESSPISSAVKDAQPSIFDLVPRPQAQAVRLNLSPVGNP